MSAEEANGVTWKIKLLAYSACAVAAVVYLVFIFMPVGPEEQRQGDLLKNIATEIQYPRAKRVNERVSLKVNQASLYANYKYTEPAQDDFKNVAEFYHQQLTTKGWTKDETDSAVAGQRARSVYRKQGGYEITIYEGDRNPYDFIIYYKWDRP